MVKLSISRYQDASPPVEETPRVKQTDTDNAHMAIPVEDSGSRATAAQIEAVANTLAEFQNALEREDYEQAWKFMADSFKSKRTFEKFKEEMLKVRATLAKATMRPESATDIRGRVGVLVAIPSVGDERWFFVQEEGQWKLDP